MNDVDNPNKSLVEKMESKDTKRKMNQDMRKFICEILPKHSLQIAGNFIHNLSD